jgi:hypothetical protein
VNEEVSTGSIYAMLVATKCDSTGAIHYGVLLESVSSRSVVFRRIGLFRERSSTVDEFTSWMKLLRSERQSL